MNISERQLYIKNLHAIQKFTSTNVFVNIDYNNGRRIELIHSPPLKFSDKIFHDFWTNDVFKTGIPIRLSVQLDFWIICYNLKLINLLEGEIVSAYGKTPPLSIKLTSICGKDVNYDLR